MYVRHVQRKKKGERDRQRDRETCHRVSRREGDGHVRTCVLSHYGEITMPATRCIKTCSARKSPASRAARSLAFDSFLDLSFENPCHLLLSVSPCQIADYFPKLRNQIAIKTPANIRCRPIFLLAIRADCITYDS